MCVVGQSHCSMNMYKYVQNNNVIIIIFTIIIIVIIIVIIQRTLFGIKSLGKLNLHFSPSLSFRVSAGISGPDRVSTAVLKHTHSVTYDSDVGRQQRTQFECEIEEFNSAGTQSLIPALSL